MNLTRQLRGKQVVAVLTNGYVIQLRLADGGEINIKWVDDNGTAIKGHPVVENAGWRALLNTKEIVSGQSLGIRRGYVQ